MDATVRRLRARLGGYARAARYDGAEITAAARRAFYDRFLDEVDPERTLSEAERERRAEAARCAYYTRLALKSAQARARKKKSRQRAHLAAEEAAGGGHRQPG